MFLDLDRKVIGSPKGMAMGASDSELTVQRWDFLDKWLILRDIFCRGKGIYVSDSLAGCPPVLSS